MNVVDEEVDVPDESNSEDPLRSYVIRQEIMKSLDKMKPKMKQIFTLSKIEGLTYGEIASYLNVSKRTVEDNIAKALIILKDELKNNETIFS
jgi:RNA polymerase sigma-70 factor (ECF subfamily)